jgi:hypothetical protein
MNRCNFYASSLLVCLAIAPSVFAERPFIRPDECRMAIRFGGETIPSNVTALDGYVAAMETNRVTHIHTLHLADLNSGTSNTLEVSEGSLFVKAISDGNVAVSDPFNDILTIVDVRAGKIKETTSPGTMVGPWQLAFSGSILYGANQAKSQIVRYDTTSNRWLSFWPVSPAFTEIAIVGDVLYGVEGDILRGQRTIQAIDLSNGKAIGSFQFNLVRKISLVDDQLCVADSGDAKIFCGTASQGFIEFAEVDSSLYGIVEGNGLVWVTSRAVPNVSSARLKAFEINRPGAPPVFDAEIHTFVPELIKPTSIAWDSATSSLLIRGDNGIAVLPVKSDSKVRRALPAFTHKSHKLPK